MLRLGACALVCVALFAGAFAAAHVLQTRLAVDAAAPPNVVSDSPSETGVAAQPVGLYDASHDEPNAELAIPVRPRPISAEEVVHLGAVIREREGLLQAQESVIEKERLQLQLIAEDINAERRELDGLRAAIRDDIGSAEKLLAALAEQQQQIQQERKQAQEELEAIKATQTTYQENERANLSKMSLWFQNMEPATAANYLKELSNDGKLDLVVQLLGEFEPRDAAEIIAEMNDPQLVAQVTEKTRGLQQPKKDRLPR